MDVQWKLAKSIFQHAIELPPEARESYIRSHCDEETSAQVLKMVKTHFDEPEFLENPFSIEDSSVAISRDPLIGRSLGSFVIQRRIGKGGMGAVYEASQSKPQRQVAIKVLRHDNEIDDATLRRFQNESEVLAKLQHPNIAHVYASGTFKDTDGIQPWFAMELVDGFTLRQFIRQNELTVVEKLNLFLRICDAVSHAHNRDVIHRDLKPANILIKSDSEQPKIVDFGIARVIAGHRMGESMTRTQDILGTIDYMSPEQVTEKRFDLDQRCDVYSLGVIVFEMLTERLPHDRKSKAISKVISQLDSEPGLKLRQVDRQYSKDLEVVIAKAIFPDAERRYATVEEFADDIRRYLSSEPVLARPPSLRYRTSKYVSRNKVLVGGAATTILALLAGLFTYAMIAQKAKQAAAEARYEAEKAVAVNSFITNDFLTRLLNNVRSDGSSESVNLDHLIDSSSEKIDSMFLEQPLVKAAIRNEVGTVFYNVGSYGKASVEYRKALELWEAGLGPMHPDTLKAVSNLAQARMANSQGNHPETIALSQRAFEGRKKVLGLGDPATIRSLNNLAQIFRSSGRVEEGKELFLQGLKELNATTAEAMSTRFTLAANLGSLYLKENEPEKALKLHRESYESAREVFGIKHPLSLQTGVKYVQTLDRLEQFAEAESQFQPILQEYKLIGESNPGVLFVPYRLLARIYRHQGRTNEAKEVLNEVREVAEQSPEKFGDVLPKIKRDLRRLDKQ